MSTTAPVSDVQYVKLPDGSYGKFAANATDDVIRSSVAKDFPDAFKPTADTRSLYEKARDNFNANTQHVPTTGIKSVIQNFGAGGADVLRAAKHAFDHDPDSDLTLQQLADKRVAQGQQIVNDPIAAVASSAGAMGTGAVLGEAFGAAAKAVPKAMGAVGDTAAAAKMKLRPSPSPAIVAVEEVQAQKIAQAILPPGGIKPEMLKAIQQEAPAVVEYAKRTGNPLNTQAEGLKAARGVAEEGRQHFNTEIRDPVAYRSVALDPQATTLGEKATIGEIDAKITDLNHKINTGGANSQGAALDVEAKSRWSDELQYLRGKYYSALEHTTGVPAADLLNLREGYGGSYTLADNLEAAQNARLTRTGKISQGQQSIELKRPSILELPGQVVNAVRGGEQAISDRQFAAAMKEVQPQAPVRPTPPPVDTEAVAAQQAQAKQQFMLEEQSKVAAAGRDSQVQEFKQERDALPEGSPPLVRKGFQNVYRHLSIDGSSGITRADIVRSGWSQTPEGKSLLSRASSVTPDSPMMRKLVDQIKAKVGK